MEVKKANTTLRMQALKMPSNAKNELKCNENALPFIARVSNRSKFD